MDTRVVVYGNKRLDFIWIAWTRLYSRVLDNVISVINMRYEYLR